MAFKKAISFFNCSVLMKIMKFIPLFLLFCFISNFAKSQGCSDAGVCSLNAFKPAGEDDLVLNNHFKIGLSNGLADYDISIFGAYLEYGRRFNDKLGMDVKLGGLGQSGNDVSGFGLSDIYVNANYALNEKTGLVLGAKIPLNKADRQKDGLPLPMDYQSSLGTVDLVLGVSRQFNKLLVVAAYQQPLTQNDNAFLSEEYSLGSKLQEIQSTNQFQRSGDVLLRLSYPIHFGEKLRITPSILPIYHLGEDKFTNANGIEQAIAGSDGFTLNGNVFVDYGVGKNGNLQLSLASPFIVREARPDGLTRGYVVGFEYGVRF